MSSHSVPTNLGCAVMGGALLLYAVYLIAFFSIIVGGAFLIWKHIL